MVEKIDLSDIPEITDFSKARKNPFAEKIRKYGFSVTEHSTKYYSPDDVEKMLNGDTGLMELDADELEALAEYEKLNFA